MFLGKVKFGIIEVLISKVPIKTEISHDEFVILNNVL